MKVARAVWTLAKSERIARDEKANSISINIVGGTATVTTNPVLEAFVDDTVSVNISNIEEGKKFKSILVNKADTSEITTVEITTGESYSFTMPAMDVIITVELEDTEVVYAYFEDFEDTNGGFTSGGTGNLWQWGTPISWPSAAYSGDKCWGTNLSGYYLSNSDSYLQSSTIQLTGVPLGSDLYISWRQAWELESNTWDNATAEYSINNGPWVGIWNHSSGTITQGWTELGYTLNDYNGEEIKIKWRLWTDSSVVYAGVYIDDFSIQEVNE